MGTLRCPGALSISIAWLLVVCFPVVEPLHPVALWPHYQLLLLSSPLDYIQLGCCYHTCLVHEALLQVRSLVSPHKSTARTAYCVEVTLTLSSWFLCGRGVWVTQCWICVLPRSALLLASPCS